MEHKLKDKIEEVERLKIQLLKSKVQEANLVHQYAILELYYKYQLQPKDSINEETGVIYRYIEEKV